MIKILSQSNDASKYLGTIGTPTNMYDYTGQQLFVGDVVCLVTYSADGKKDCDYGIEFVCEENVKIANWSGENRQYVNGIASLYNNKQFKILSKFKQKSDEWYEAIYNIDPDFRVYKVKDYSNLVLNERIGYLHVIKVTDLESKY